MDYITQIFLFIFYDISLCNKNTYHYFLEKEKTQPISQLRFAYIIQIKYELASLMLIPKHP